MSREDGVEFLDGAANGEVDEELPQPAVRRPRPWIVRIAVAAAVLVVAGAVVRAATDRPHDPQARSTTVVAAPTAPTTPTVPAVPTRQPRRDADPLDIPTLLTPPECPPAGDGFKACTTSLALPAAFLTAVHTQFPSAKVVAITSEVVRAAGAEVVHTLWSRQFTAEVGTTSLHVVVSAGIDPRTANSNSFDDGLRVRTASWYLTGSLAVQVFASAPSGREPSSVKLGRLARDPRVRRVS